MSSSDVSVNNGASPPKRFSHFANITSGFFASVVMSSIFQPLDLIKIKMQQTQEKQKFVHVLKNIYSTNGMFAFYRGTMLAFIAGGCVASSRMYIYKFFEHKSNEPGLLAQTSTRIFASSAVIGIFTALIQTPVEHIRIRMNCPVYGNDYSGSIDALIKMRRIYGFKNVMRGYSLTVMREFCYYIFFFNIYENTRNVFTSMGYKNIGVSMGGMTSGPISWFMTYPLDTLKTQMQTDHLASPVWTLRRYLAHLARCKLLLTLYNGLATVLMRSVLTNLLYFNIWENSLAFFEHLEQSYKE
jgi:Mitochondrial carrier protein